MSTSSRAILDLNGSPALAELAAGHRTLAEKAFAILHAAVLSGALAPGRRLPIEDLAADLQMSPMPIREALRQLDSVGLVEHIPHRGARVAELSVQDLREVYEARLALEPLAIRHAAEQFSEANAQTADAALKALEKAYRSKDDAAIWAAHTAFHFSLYGPADSRWLERLITPLWESSERYRRATPAPRKMADRRGEHARMLAACVANDPDTAARELHNHLALTANQVSTEMGGEILFEIYEESVRARSR